MFDFASGFKNDTAKLYVDGKLIFEEKLTSEPSAGYADGITIKKSSKSIEIEIVINDSQWSSSLDLDLGHFFSISYLDKQVEIQQSKIPFYYD